MQELGDAGGSLCTPSSALGMAWQPLEPPRPPPAITRMDTPERSAMELGRDRSTAML